jgi:hypothetical protein
MIHKYLFKGSKQKRRVNNHAFLTRERRKCTSKILIAAMILPSLLSTGFGPAMQSHAAESKTKGTDEYQSRFLELWGDIKDPKNGYFSPKGIPYHSVETLIVEAPDYGHVTTSEAFSYYMWLEAMYGKFSGDFSGFKTAWNKAETYMIPTEKDQPNTSMSKYTASKPATYAPEWELPSKYPAQLNSGAAVGVDPINSDLVSTYGNSMIYGMHWLLDVDNWYGYGSRGDGVTTPSYINTFQRGEQESTFETIPQPCWDAMKFGGKNGYLDLFTGDSNYATQFKYTDAPDADARAVQATYWADQWADEYGIDLGTYDKKASKMGDYLRYAMFDKYFRKIGSPTVAGTGYDAAHYLMSWYYAWGGGVSSDWAWKIGSSHNHFGYQNPMAAWILSENEDLKPLSQKGAGDWKTSLNRQLEFYQWLQSSEGAIAGGASNSNKGRYEALPAGTSTFYGMGYEANPVYADPGSNTWFGFQAWSMQRVAEYYYKTNDVRAKAILDKWVSWIKSVVQLNADGTFALPNGLDWSGQPDTWAGTYTGNSKLHVTVTSYGKDLGVAGSLANALLYYSKASGDDDSRVMAKELLDRMWNLYRDDKGVAVPESRADYKRIFDQEVFVPAGWTGTMPNGDAIKSGIKFIDIRSKYKNDPDYQKILTAYNNNTDPVFTYHRFWAQCDIAIANGVYSLLFGDGNEPVSNSSISPTTASFDKNITKQSNIVVALTLNGNTLTGIKDGSTYLAEGTDYTVTGSTVTLSKDYLSDKSVGELKLVFDFSKGVDPALTVTVTDTTLGGSVSPASATFDKNITKQADIVTTLDSAGNTLKGIKLGNLELIEDEDYTISGSTVTFLKDSLADLQTGTYKVVFDLSAGKDPVLVLTVVDTSIAKGSIKVQMYNGTTSEQTSSLSPKIKLYNTGTTSVKLSDVTIRYYYTINGEMNQNFWCDWSTIGSSNVTGTFVKMPVAETDADHYLEIGFTSGAGNLAAGEAIEVQGRVTKNDWTNYTQTDDYSFAGSGSGYVDWSKVTGYLSDSLNWGVEP